MAETMNDIMHPSERSADAEFPFAPGNWNRSVAEKIAAQDQLRLKADHWETIRALQEYFSKHDKPKMREIHDALTEKFYAKGGIRYVYQLFPGGPIAQGCRVAGLEPPAGASDKGFGSVV